MLYPHGKHAISTTVSPLLGARPAPSHRIFVSDNQPQDHLVHLGQCLGDNYQGARLVREQLPLIRYDYLAIAAHELDIVRRYIEESGRPSDSNT